MARVWRGAWTPQKSSQASIGTRSTRGPRSSQNAIKRPLSWSAAGSAAF